MTHSPEHQTFGIPAPEFRLPSSTHVGGVILRVSDLERSTDYYQRVIGLVPRQVAEHSVTLSADGETFPLVTLQTSPGVVPARRGAIGLYHFAILLPDRAALGRFASHLGRLGVHVGMADHLVSEALYLTDPDRLGIEVYADRPRDGWKRQGPELVMTVDPLDIADVIAAAGGEPWTGMPRGTTMGHVHLHVGDLDRAEAFYHRALGLDKTVWTFPGALFLSAGGYHHHLGTNVWSSAPGPTTHEAQLIEWTLVVPSPQDVTEAAASLRAAGCTLDRGEEGAAASDPWGTRVRIRSS